MNRSLVKPALACLSLLASSAACSPPVQGEILVVVETDMSVLKDIDAIKIEAVLPSGDVVPAVGFLDLFDSQKKTGIKLPGTLGFVVDSDLNADVTFQVSAWKGENPRVPRVLREVKATIPEDKALMLRMPLQWLCDGMFFEKDSQDEEKLISTCPEGTTCVDGACASPGEPLPYDATKVFGSELGGEFGVCFDTSSCFKGSFRAAPESKEDGKCVVSSGGKKDVNVALSTETDGICGPDGCFVPLDAPGAEIWKIVKGEQGEDLIDLPMEVCLRKELGTLLEVVVQDVATCGRRKTADMPLCGSWSSVGAAIPRPGEEEPVTLAAGQNTPVALAVDVDAERLFWANVGTYNMSNIVKNSGNISAIPLPGGTRIPLSSGEDLPRNLALMESASKIFWTNEGSSTSNPGDGKVVEIVINSEEGKPGKRTEVAFDLKAPNGIALNDMNLFYTTEDGVWSRPLENLTMLEHVVQDAMDPSQIAADDTTLFWIEKGKNGVGGTVNRCPISSCTERMSIPADGARYLFVQRNVDTQIVVAVFWTIFTESGAVMKVDVENGMFVSQEPTPIATEQSFPAGVAADPNNVFWTNRGDGTVQRADKDGGHAEPIATGQRSPSALVLDDKNVYWLNEVGGGAVMKIAKDAPPVR